MKVVEPVEAPAADPRPHAARPILRALATRREARRLDRRAVYLGEGLSLRLVWQGASIAAEVIDLTPQGLGIAVLEDAPLPMVGDEVLVEYTGRAPLRLRQRAIVRSSGEVVVGDRVLPRIGLSFAEERTPGGFTQERRRSERYVAPEAFPALASAMCPLFFREWLHFTVREVSGGGMAVTTSMRNKALLPGLELDLTLTLPMSGAHPVRGRIVSARLDEGGTSFVVGFAWIDPSRALLAALSEYLLLGDKKLTPARLRESGLEVRSVERAVTYNYAVRPQDYEDVLKLRLRAHQHEGRFEGATVAGMASPFDAHARHLTCRFGSKIVGYVRVIYVDGDPARSQYVSMGGHSVPSWLWKAGFVEAGAGATDPEFQRAGLFVPLMQHAVRVALQSGHRYMLGACSDELLDMYQQMGFEVLETRMVEPKGGWSFRSHLFCMDIQKLLEDPPVGKTVEAMASVVSFVGWPCRDAEEPSP